jgi:hypothetical protein
MRSFPMFLVKMGYKVLIANNFLCKRLMIEDHS